MVLAWFVAGGVAWLWHDATTLLSTNRRTGRGRIMIEQFKFLYWLSNCLSKDLMLTDCSSKSVIHASWLQSLDLHLHFHISALS